MEEVLASSKMTYSEFVSAHTTYKDYTVDKSVRGLPAVTSLISEALLSCIKENYDIYSYTQWPFSLSFPTTMDALSICLTKALPTVNNRLTYNLIIGGFSYSDVNMAYMPNQNIEDQHLPMPDDVTNNPSLACIFDNLNAQNSLVSSQVGVS